MHHLAHWLRAGAAVAAAAALAPAASLAHGEPTCAGVGGIENHAQHILGDYITGLGGLGGGIGWPPAGEVGEAVKANGGALVPGGPGPGFHFTIPGLPPGASFCLEQAHPNGFNTPETRRNQP
jgi:hypothetical protein